MSSTRDIDPIPSPLRVQRHPQDWSEEYRQIGGLLGGDVAELIEAIDDRLDMIQEVAALQEEYYVSAGEEGDLPSKEDWAKIAVTFDELGRFSRDLSLRLALTSSPYVRPGRPSPISTRVLRKFGASDSFVRRVQRARQSRKA